MYIVRKFLAPLCCSAGFVVMTLLAACGGGHGRAVTLSTLAVTPATATLAIGVTQQMAATATFSDGSTSDVGTASAWTSATPANATVNATSGLATAAAAGSAVISAAYGGMTASATLTVSPAAPVSIAITPQSPTVTIAASQQLTVIATYPDTTTLDVTSSSAFVSGTPATASVTSGGLITGLAAGSSIVTASFGGANATTTITVPSGISLASIAVTPQSPTVLIAATRQLTVIATYSDTNTVDVTTGSTFVSATPATASVANGGLVTGVAAGSSIVTASFGGANATTTVTVPVGLTVSSVAVTPVNPSVVVGAQQQFVATATYSDSSSAVISAAWGSSATGVATVDSNGLATGVAAGTSTITASFGGQNGSAPLLVRAAPLVGTLNLRSAANFGVLAGTSIANNAGGTTFVTGDVGSPSQPSPPAQAAGYSNYTSGTILSTALTDLQTALTDAGGRTCNVNFFGGIDLGGLIIGPGVYCFSGAINITGTLTLSGPGVYIFRTALTLSTTANSIVALSNGATAAEVNWVPTGTTAVGANSNFKGNILSQSAITVGNNATLVNGRVLTTTTTTLSNNQISY
jgi:uncharacterized protein YjdB